MDWTEEDDAPVTHEFPGQASLAYVDVFHTGRKREQMSKGARCTYTYAQTASIEQEPRQGAR